MAALAFAKGNYIESERLLKNSIEILEKSLGVNHPKAAMSYHDLGKTYYRLGKYSDAEELYNKSLEIRQKAFSNRSHPDIAQNLVFK